MRQTICQHRLGSFTTWTCTVALDICVRDKVHCLFPLFSTDCHIGIQATQFYFDVRARLHRACDRAVIVQNRRLTCQQTAHKKHEAKNAAASILLGAIQREEDVTTMGEATHETSAPQTMDVQAHAATKTESTRYSSKSSSLSLSLSSSGSDDDRDDHSRVDRRNSVLPPLFSEPFGASALSSDPFSASLHRHDDDHDHNVVPQDFQEDKVDAAPLCAAPMGRNAVGVIGGTSSTATPLCVSAFSFGLGLEFCFPVR
jgi:hypothetical protein